MILAIEKILASSALCSGHVAWSGKCGMLYVGYRGGLLLGFIGGL